MGYRAVPVLYIRCGDLTNSTVPNICVYTDKYVGTQGGEQVRVFVGWVVFTETHRPVYYIFHLRMVFPPYDILMLFFSTGKL